MKGCSSRRDFLAASTVALIAQSLRVTPLWGADKVSPQPAEHPAPRPGITSAKVLRPDQLSDAPDAIPAFDRVREIPEIIDGIRCNCGCAELEGYYSLLTCYEGPDAMAKHCEICQGQARLAHRMHKSGKSLDEIRKGIDARFSS